MILFMEKFPDMGEKETRVVAVLQRVNPYLLPPDEYAFVEYYCEEEDCDCRRVMIWMFARKAEKVLATISLGFDFDDDDAGPFLDPLNIQSEHSRDLLNLFIDTVNSDPAYMARLQRHYVMFKEKIYGEKYTGEPFERPRKLEAEGNLPPFPFFSKPKPIVPKPAVPSRTGVGRNDPCPCGSGKKYKRCCLISSK